MSLNKERKTKKESKKQESKGTTRSGPVVVVPPSLLYREKQGEHDRIQPHKATRKAADESKEEQ